MEMLSTEILLRLDPLPEVQAELPKMRDLLTTADLVKFAKANPLPNENDLYFSYAVDFVKNTALVEQQTDDKQQPNKE
jgi:hypothetical protein